MRGIRGIRGGLCPAASSIRRRERSITSTPTTAPRCRIPTAGSKTTTRRDRRVGRGAEQGDVPVSREDPVPRAAPAARQAAERLREVLGAVRKGPYFFFRKNDGLQNQSVLYIQKGLDGDARSAASIPNTWSEDGTVRLGAFAPSKDAKYAVYGISRSGSDWQEYKVMELATKKTLADTLEWVKVSSVAWHGDGFYYSRYPAPEKGRRRPRSTRTTRSTSTASARRSPQDVLVYAGRGEPAALPHRRDDRGRAVRAAVDLGPRQGQGRQRAVRARPVEGRARVHAGRRDDRRRLLRRRRQRRRQAAHRDEPQGAELARGSGRSGAAGRGELEDRPARAAGAAPGRQRRPAASCSRRISRT